jgi:ubiquinone/menaquinone biosynthesis C-methylase UbiE
MNDGQDTYYSDNYDLMLNKGILGSFKNVTHRFIEYPFSGSFASKILELGAGNGYHKKFVSQKFDTYIESDLRSNPNSSIIAIDAENLSRFGNEEFDRIIATCLLAHLNHPQKALQEWRRCVKNNGTISIYVPCEPGSGLRLFRFFTTNLKSKIMKIDHYKFHYIEHRNYYLNLKYLLNETFGEDKIRKRHFPFPFLSWNFNFFVIYEIKVVK